MRGLSIIILVLFTSSPIIAQLGAKTQQGKIHGTWHNNDFGYQMTLILRTDGTGELDRDGIIFTSQGNKLTIKELDETNIYTFALQGNSLTVSGGDLEQAITFTRIGTSTQAAPEEKNSAANTSASAKLIGSWSGHGETIEFKNNGQCVYLGQIFPYSATGNNITLQTSQGNVATWWVEGNRIHYNSQTQGQGSYELVKQNHPKNGDPMIVLDGTTYVTYFQKSPW